MHPLVVVLALFIGAETLGILGALLAVPLAVIVQALLDEFWTFSEPSTETTTSGGISDVPREPLTIDDEGATDSFKGARQTSGE